jgi:hypothetical protein
MAKPGGDPSSGISLGDAPILPKRRALIPTTSCSAPVLRIGTLILVVCATWTSPLASERQVLTFHKSEKTSTPPVRHCPQKDAPHCRGHLGTSTNLLGRAERSSFKADLLARRRSGLTAKARTIPIRRTLSERSSTKFYT